jgi:tripartite-type tricarboxylate transporter receptor subunit TctC
MSRRLTGFTSGKLRHVTRPGVVIASGMLLVSLLGSLPARAAVRPQRAVAASTSTVKPNLAFFKGKTITYIVPNTPGSTAGLVIVAMQQALEQYLGATINIEYLSSGGSSVGDDVIGHSTPDGLTIGDLPVSSTLNAIYAATGSINFPVVTTSFVGGTRQAPLLLVACQGSGITSFSQLVQNHTPATFIDPYPGQADELGHLLSSAYGISLTYFRGYTSSTQLVGCERGDAALTTGTASNYLTTAGTAMVPGITPILMLGSEASSSPQAFLNSVPKLSAFATTHKVKTANEKEALSLAIGMANSSAPQFATFGPPGIPAPQLLALSDAFKAAAQLASVRQAFLNAGLPAGWVPGTTIHAAVKSQIEHQKVIERFLTN